MDVEKQNSGGLAEADEPSTFAFNPLSSNQNSDCPAAALADGAKRHLDAHLPSRSMGQAR